MTSDISQICEIVEKRNEEEYIYHNYTDSIPLHWGHHSRNALQILSLAVDLRWKDATKGLSFLFFSPLW